MVGHDGVVGTTQTLLALVLPLGFDAPTYRRLCYDLDISSLCLSFTFCFLRVCRAYVAGGTPRLLLETQIAHGNELIPQESSQGCRRRVVQQDDPSVQLVGHRGSRRCRDVGCVRLQEERRL